MLPLLIALTILAVLIALFQSKRRNKAALPNADDGTWQLKDVVSSTPPPKPTTRTREKQPTPICVVIGGSGFLGKNLCRRILREGKYQLRIADIRPPHESAGLSSAEFVKTDLCDLVSVRSAVNGADVVFHCATAAPTAANALNNGLMYSVNVTGTRNALQACAEGGVTRFVFTSSASVVFDGSPLNGATEDMPYARVHIDYYTQTKAEAERCVLGADGVGGMKTVALRPSGIFGEDDPQMTPIIVQQANSGKARYIVGDGSNLFDFTYVGNVCQSHTMAAEALAEPLSTNKVHGKAYFITNADPQPFWQFLGQMLEGLGFPAALRPHKKMPLWVIMPLANVMEFIMFVVSPVFKFESNLSVTRMLLASTNRHISCARAKKDFNYVPEVSIPEALKITVEHFSALRYKGAKKHE